MSLNWLKISGIANSKIVKSMLIWMFITPVIAKGLSSVNSIHFSFLKENNNITLSLPFSWQIFFFCALSFTIANIIYSIKCPELIRNYRCYSEFETNDNSLFLLINHINERIVRENFLKIGEIVSKYTPTHEIAIEWTSDDTSNVNWKKGIDSLKQSHESYKPDVFSSVRIFLSSFYPNWIKACLFFYGIGFLGILIVIMQNIIYVSMEVRF